MECFGCVFCCHLDQGLILTTLRNSDRHLVAPHVPKPGFYDPGLVDLVLHEDLGWDAGRLVIELLDEGSHHASSFHSLGSLQHKVLVTDELAVADEEHLDARLRFVASQGDDVLVLKFWRNDLLALGDALDGQKFVANSRRTLELQPLCSGLHLLPQVRKNLLCLAFEKETETLDHCPVFFSIHDADARRLAQPDVVVQTRAFVLAGDGAVAGQVGEDLAQCV